MHHFIYKTISSSGKFYIGRHSTNNLNDNYFCSGKWIRSIKDKSILSREILEFSSNFEELKLLEEKYLKEYINDPNNMNFNNNYVGFGIGDMNPNRWPERQKNIK